MSFKYWPVDTVSSLYSVKKSVLFWLKKKTKKQKTRSTDKWIVGYGALNDSFPINFVTGCKLQHWKYIIVEIKTG